MFKKRDRQRLAVAMGRTGAVREITVVVLALALVACSRDVVYVGAGGSTASSTSSSSSSVSSSTGSPVCVPNICKPGAAGAPCFTDPMQPAPDGACDASGNCCEAKP